MTTPIRGGHPGGADTATNQKGRSTEKPGEKKRWGVGVISTSSRKKKGQVKLKSGSSRNKRGGQARKSFNWKSTKEKKNKKARTVRT